MSTVVAPQKGDYMADEWWNEYQPTTPDRQHSESSEAQSEFVGVEPTLTSIDHPSREFHAFHARWHLDLRIHDAQDSPLYYVDTSIFAQSRPDIMIHQNGDKTGPVVGIVNYIAFSSNLKVGVGDPTVNNGNDIVWEDVIKTSRIKHSAYKWSMVIPSLGTRQTFIWRRTHHYGLEPDSKSAKWATVNFKLEDVETGKIVANFATTGRKMWNKIGKFVVQRAYEPEWEFMVLLTGLAIIQKARRRERLRSRGASDGAWG